MEVPEIRAYYDPEIDLLMVELPHDDAPPANGQTLAPDVFVELEPEGAPLVLEVLRASEHYPAEWLRGIPAAPDESAAGWPLGGHETPVPPADFRFRGPHGRRAARRRVSADR